MKKKIWIGCGAVLLVGVVAVLLAVGYAAIKFKALNVEGQYFDSGGIRIHYYEQGKGTPVILVHGLGASITTNWMTSKILPELAKQYRVIALDNRGHGRSGKPHDPSQYGVEMVKDIVRLMDHLGIEKAHVVGYSMGGFITVKLATMYPDRLLSVAPCGAGWTGEPDKDLAFLDQLADDLDKGKGFGLLLERLQPVGKRVGKAKVMAVDIAMRAANDITALAAALRGMKELRVTEEELRKNTVPALAIIGERDPLKVFADQLAATMGNIKEVVLPEANHFSTTGRAEFIKALKGFLAEHSPKASVKNTTSVLPNPWVLPHPRLIEARG